MSTKSRPVPINPIWQPRLWFPACERRRHLSGELPLKLSSRLRRVSSTPLPPSSCIFPVINRKHPPATRLSRPHHHTLRVSSRSSLPSDAQHDLAEMRVGAHMRLRRGGLVE